MVDLAALDAQQLGLVVQLRLTLGVWGRKLEGMLVSKNAHTGVPTGVLQALNLAVLCAKDPNNPPEAAEASAAPEAPGQSQSPVKPTCGDQWVEVQRK
eukprot:11414964-Prorocentrum_lima.AAC.1